MSFKLAGVFLAVLLLAYIKSFSQISENQVYTAVELPANYPGGMDNFIHYLEANTRYPDKARQNSIKGKVNLSFLIEKDGSISDIKVLRGIGFGCDEEAVRLIKALPKWIPAKQNGVVVRQIYYTSVSFGNANAPSPVKIRDMQIHSPYEAETRIDEVPSPPNKEVLGPNAIYTAVEKSAQYSAGEGAFSAYLAKNMQYPAAAQKNETTGRVFVSFVVEKDGTLTGFKVLRGIGNGCDEEAVRVIQASGKWLPGQVKGNAVRQQYTMPMSFGKAPYTAPAPAATSPDRSNMIYTVAEQQASYPGGTLAFVDYVNKNLRYPASARIKGIQGKVFVTFIIERDGMLSDIKVLRGVCSDVDEEAIRLVKASGKWLPGKFRDATVRQQYTMPVSFDLY